MTQGTSLLVPGTQHVMHHCMGKPPSFPFPLLLSTIKALAAAWYVRQETVLLPPWTDLGQHSKSCLWIIQATLSHHP